MRMNVKPRRVRLKHILRCSGLFRFPIACSYNVAKSDCVSGGTGIAGCNSGEGRSTCCPRGSWRAALLIRRRRYPVRFPTSAIRKSDFLIADVAPRATSAEHRPGICRRRDTGAFLEAARYRACASRRADLPQWERYQNSSFSANWICRERAEPVQVSGPAVESGASPFAVPAKTWRAISLRAKLG
jgi:hypothetical protein